MKIKIKIQLTILATAMLWLAFSTGVSAAESLPGDGMLTYGDGDLFSYAKYCYDALSNCGGNERLGAFASASAGTINPLWHIQRASPKKNSERIVANIDSSGKLEVLRWDGTTWTLEWTENNAGNKTLDTRAFDVAYETSGEAVVAWGNHSATTNELEYIVWDGSSWSASASYDLTLGTASISWIEMASHPASGSNQNDIGLCYVNVATGTQVGCVIWDGDNNTWGNEPSSLITSSGEEGSAGVGTTKSVGAFYENNSGQFIVVTGTGECSNDTSTTKACAASASFDSTYGWSDIGTFPVYSNNNQESPSVIACTNAPNILASSSNDALCSMFSTNAGDSGGIYYNGETDTFVARSNFDTAAAPVGTGGISNAALFLRSSNYNVGAAIWGDIGDDSQVDYWRWIGGAWSSGASSATPPTATIEERNMFALGNPFFINTGLYLFTDNENNLFVLEASLSGSTFTFSQVSLNSGRVITTDMLDNGAASSSQFFFAYDIAPLASQTHFRWRNDDGSLATATTISDEDVPASGSEALSDTAVSRLRVQISNEGVATMSNNNWQLEFTKKDPTLQSCATPSPGWGWRELHMDAQDASDAFDIEDSPNFTNGDPTANEDTGSLTDMDPTFVAGQGIDAASSTSAGIVLTYNNFTELEYALKANSNAQSGATYCFRVSNGGVTDVTGWNVYAKASVSAAATPTITQKAYRFFENANATQIGGPLANVDTPASVNTQTGEFRLRLAMDVSIANMGLSGQAFKIQAANKGAGTCASPDGTYTDISSTTSISFNDNTKAAVTDGAALDPNTLDPVGTGTRREQTYEEANNFSNGISVINAGEYGLWDFSLKDRDAGDSDTFCFRVVKSSEQTLTYTVYPEISMYSSASAERSRQAGGGGVGTDNGESGGGGAQEGGGGGGGGGSEGGGSGGGGGEGGGGGGGGGGSPVLYTLYRIINFFDISRWFR